MTVRKAFFVVVVPFKVLLTNLCFYIFYLSEISDFEQRYSQVENRQFLDPHYNSDEALLYAIFRFMVICTPHRVERYDRFI